MIARVWRGWTTADNASAYERLLRERVLPGISAMNLPGYHGGHVLRRLTAERPGDGEVEFMTLLWFDSMEGPAALVRGGAAGDEQDASAVHVPQAARDVLKRFDERSAHFEVALTPEQTR